VPARLLIVDDRRDQLERLQAALVAAGLSPDRIVTAMTGRDALARHDVDVVVALCDLSFETADPRACVSDDPSRDGIALALALQRQADERGWPRPEVFLHTAFPGEVRAGALANVHVATLTALDAPLGRVAAVFADRERQLAHRRALVDRAWMSRFSGVWTPSLLARADTLAIAVVEAHLPVLITGPTGSGKEGIARLIHDSGVALGARRGDYVAFSCAGLTEGTAESELFGHEKGAFTGADRRRDGLWALAEAGTLVLDEVHALSPAMQARLLRALSPGMIRPVGGSERPARDTRVIALGKPDLKDEVDAKRFSSDLYFRLRGIAVELPGLTGQPEDIRALSRYIAAGSRGEGPRELSAEAEDELAARAWEGNVRELETAVLLARAQARARGAARIERVDVPEAAHGGAPAGRYAALIRDHEDRLRLLAAEAWQAAGYSLKAAVDATGIPKTTLWRLLREQAELWKRSERAPDPVALARRCRLVPETVRRLLDE
jgi:DNA-binding NtrC family response regulator